MLFAIHRFADMGIQQSAYDFEKEDCIDYSKRRLGVLMRQYGKYRINKNIL